MRAIPLAIVIGLGTGDVYVAPTMSRDVYVAPTMTASATQTMTPAAGIPLEIDIRLLFLEILAKQGQLHWIG